MAFRDDKDSFVTIDNSEFFAFAFGGVTVYDNCFQDVVCFKRQHKVNNLDYEASEYLSQVTPAPSPLLQPVSGAQAVTIDKDIYVTGGYQEYVGDIYVINKTDTVDTSGCQVYKSEIDRWILLPGFAIFGRRTSHGSCALNKLLFVVGGCDSYEEIETQPDHAAILRMATSTQVLDTRTAAWRQVADTNDPHACCFGAVTVFDSIYVLGGSNSRSVEQYDAAADRWRRVAPTLHTHNLSAVCVFRDEIYVLGCECNNNCRVCEKYSPKTDTWTRLPDLPFTWYGGAAYVTNKYIYCVGGISYLHDWYALSDNCLQMNETLAYWTRSLLVPPFKRRLFASAQLLF